MSVILTLNWVFFSQYCFSKLLSETWLCNEVNDCELGLLLNYIIFRCDFGYLLVNNRGCDRYNVFKIREGGALITIKNHYQCCHLTIQNNIIG